MAGLTDTFARQRSRLVLFARSYTRDREAAEDIVMHALADTWERRDGLREEDDLSACLLAAVRERLLDTLRKQEAGLPGPRRRELSLRLAALEACDPRLPFREESRRLVRAAVDSLPATSREVFVLSRLERLPDKEVSLRLDLSLKTTEFHVARSLRRLRTMLKDGRPSGDRDGRKGDR